jgi:hypothetical protein
LSQSYIIAGVQASDGKLSGEQVVKKNYSFCKADIEAKPPEIEYP